MPIQLSDHFTYKKLIRFTLPSMAMMIFTSIYGVVDGFFVSNFAGKTSFAAVNLIMPFLLIVSTVGMIFGTGGTAMIAKTLGEGDREKANEYFSLFTYVAFGLGIVFSILGNIFMPSIARALGAEGKMLEDCILYGRMSFNSMPFYILQLLFQSFFVVAEKPRLGLAVTMSAGFTNMILDAVLVLSLPQEYKLLGAVLATNISELVAATIPLIYFSRKNTSLFRFGKTGFYGRAIIKACTNGSSEFMSNVSMNVVAMLYNMQLMKYAGENGVAAYGVILYICLIFNGAFIGYSIGSSPVVGFNKGAKNYRELKSIFKKSLVIIGVLSICMVLAGEALAWPLGKLFVGYNQELLKLTVSGFRIFSFSFLFMGYAIYGSGFFTALNDGVTSAIISTLRTMVFQVAAILLLPLLFGIDGIWYSIILAEFMAMVLSVVFIIAKRKKIWGSS